jgi:hypothetical protein
MCCCQHQHALATGARRGSRGLHDANQWSPQYHRWRDLLNVDSWVRTHAPGTGAHDSAVVLLNTWRVPHAPQAVGTCSNQLLLEGDMNGAAWKQHACSLCSNSCTSGWALGNRLQGMVCSAPGLHVLPATASCCRPCRHTRLCSCRTRCYTFLSASRCLPSARTSIAWLGTDNSTGRCCSCASTALELGPAQPSPGMAPSS